MNGKNICCSCNVLSTVVLLYSSRRSRNSPYVYTGETRVDSNQYNTVVPDASVAPHPADSRPIQILYTLPGSGCLTIDRKGRGN